jgi:dihydrofolate synthase/folylpolyglutamate synthase
MEYNDAVQYLDGLINYERMGLKFQIADNVRLEAILQLCQMLDNPQERFRSVHIAGTKGKGSTAAIVEAMARAAGYRTGLFTSPHLVSPRERIRLDGEMISRDDLTRLVDTVKPPIEAIRAENGPLPPSFFEAYTAMAFLAFADANVDLAVLETGLGGRFDATNVITPVACAITRIDLEHTDLLGDTVEQIAFEKAGIIKPDVPVVVADNLPQVMEVIEEVANRRGATVLPAPRVLSTEPPERLQVPDVAGPPPQMTQTVVLEHGGGPLQVEYSLLGKQQAYNLAVAVGLMDLLASLGFDRLDEAVIQKGARQVRWPARFEIVASRPWTVLDCAHNPSSAQMLADSITGLLEYDRLIVVLGVSQDKDYLGIAEALAPITDIAVLTQADMPRSLQVSQFEVTTAHLWQHHRTACGIGEAVDMAFQMAGPRDCVVITGSFFVLDEYLQWADRADL